VFQGLYQTTTPVPLPEVTIDPAKAIFFLSLTPVSLSRIAVVFSEATDSPVRKLSSAVRLFTCTRRRSAGTFTPDSRRTMSPAQGLRIDFLFFFYCRTLLLSYHILQAACTFFCIIFLICAITLFRRIQSV
jgi:hypothetical protein